MFTCSTCGVQKGTATPARHDNAPLAPACAAMQRRTEPPTDDRVVMRAPVENNRDMVNADMIGAASPGVNHVMQRKRATRHSRRGRAWGVHAILSIVFCFGEGISASDGVM